MMRKKVNVTKKKRVIGDASIYSTPSQQAGCDTRSVFKQSTNGFNSEIFFPKTGYLI